LGVSNLGLKVFHWGKIKLKKNVAAGEARLCALATVALCRSARRRAVALWLTWRSAEGHAAATTKQRAHGRPPLQSTAARAQQHGPVRFRKPGAAKAAAVSGNQGSGGARFRKPGAGKTAPQPERHSAPQRTQKAAWGRGCCLAKAVF